MPTTVFESVLHARQSSQSSKLGLSHVPINRQLNFSTEQKDTTRLDSVLDGSAPVRETTAKLSNQSNNIICVTVDLSSHPKESCDSVDPTLTNYPIIEAAPDTGAAGMVAHKLPMAHSTAAPTSSDLLKSPSAQQVSTSSSPPNKHSDPVIITHLSTQGKPKASRVSSPGCDSDESVKITKVLPGNRNKDSYDDVLITKITPSTNASVAKDGNTKPPAIVKCGARSRTPQSAAKSPALSSLVDEIEIPRPLPARVRREFPPDQPNSPSSFQATNTVLACPDHDYEEFYASMSHECVAGAFCVCPLEEIRECNSLQCRQCAGAMHNDCALYVNYVNYTHRVPRPCCKRCWLFDKVSGTNALAIPNSKKNPPGEEYQWKLDPVLTDDMYPQEIQDIEKAVKILHGMIKHLFRKSSAFDDTGSACCANYFCSRQGGTKRGGNLVQIRIVRCCCCQQYVHGWTCALLVIVQGIEAKKSVAVQCKQCCFDALSSVASSPAKKLPIYPQSNRGYKTYNCNVDPFLCLHLRPTWSRKSSPSSSLSTPATSSMKLPPIGPVAGMVSHTTIATGMTQDGDRGVTVPALFASRTDSPSQGKPASTPITRTTTGRLTPGQSNPPPKALSKVPVSFSHKQTPMLAWHHCTAFPFCFKKKQNHPSSDRCLLCRGYVHSDPNICSLPTTDGRICKRCAHWDHRNASKLGATPPAGMRFPLIPRTKGGPIAYVLQNDPLYLNDRNTFKERYTQYTQYDSCQKKH